MELVTPTWISALRGIGVVCNIYNIAKTGDDVVEGLEEKMGWRDRRRAKKKINRHYDGRTKELNSERKDTISMMKHGDPNWKDMINLPYERAGFTVGDPDLSNQIDNSEPDNVSYGLGLDRVISAEPDRSELIHDTAKGIQELRIRIERHNKLLTKCEKKIGEYISSNERVAKRYISEKVKLEKSREDHELHLVTLDMCLGRMQIEGHDRERLDLTPVYNNATLALKSMGVLLDYGAHRNALGALNEHEGSLEIEREVDKTTLDAGMYDSDVDGIYDQYLTEHRAKDSAKASAIKKSTDLESLVIKAKAQVGV